MQRNVVAKNRSKYKRGGREWNVRSVTVTVRFKDCWSPGNRAYELERQKKAVRTMAEIERWHWKCGIPNSLEGNAKLLNVRTNHPFTRLSFYWILYLFSISATISYLKASGLKQPKCIQASRSQVQNGSHWAKIKCQQGHCFREALGENPFLGARQLFQARWLMVLFLHLESSNSRSNTSHIISLWPPFLPPSSTFKEPLWLHWVHPGWGNLGAGGVFTTF